MNLKLLEIHLALPGCPVQLQDSRTFNPVFFYGCESWLVDAAALQRLALFHNGCVRGICGINRRQVREGRITAIELLRRIRLQPIEYYLR